MQHGFVQNDFWLLGHVLNTFVFQGKVQPLKLFQ